MSKELNIIGVIPARYASHRLPAKPLVDLLGKPMVQRVYEQAKKARLLHRVIIATDDSRVEEAVKCFGAEVMMTSPDIRCGSERVAAIAMKIDGDIFVNIQGDEPLIAPEMIDQGIQLLLDDTAVPVGSLVKKIESIDDLLNANVVKVVLSSDMYGLYFSRSAIPFVRDENNARKWLERHIFYKHIGLYVFRKEFLIKYSQLTESNLERAEKLEQLRILEAGFKIKLGITTYDSVPIDIPEDVKYVTAILQKTTSGA